MAVAFFFFFLRLYGGPGGGGGGGGVVDGVSSDLRTVLGISDFQQCGLLRLWDYYLIEQETQRVLGGTVDFWLILA